MVMDMNHTAFETIPVPDYSSLVVTTKIIPIPCLLVPMFLNGGDTMNAVGAFQMFMDEFYTNVPEELKDATQYIYEYLLAAMGRNQYGDSGSPRSQLACELERIPTDATIAEWLFTHFGGTFHQARKFDESKAQVQQVSNQQVGKSTDISYQSGIVAKPSPDQTTEEVSKEVVISMQSNLIIQKPSTTGVKGNKPQAHGQPYSQGQTVQNIMGFGMQKGQAEGDTVLTNSQQVFVQQLPVPQMPINLQQHSALCQHQK